MDEYLHVVLRPLAVEPQISITSIKTGDAIRGRVEGLDNKSRAMYKIVVYVLTDAWYIHPYQSQKEGYGFAKIGKDGFWRLKTIWRGFQSSNLAVLLVPQDENPPAKVRIDYKSDYVDALLGNLEVVAKLVIDSPKGI